MSNYAQVTFFAPKDLLPNGNPSKVIFGAQVDPELAAISVAIASKYDSANISSTPILFNAGSASAPGIAFTGGTNSNTGVYLASANSLGFAANGVSAGTISSAGAWNIPAPSGSNVGLTLAGAANQYVEIVNGNSTSGQSLGLRVAAGTTNADVAFDVISQNAATNFFRVLGNGETFVLPPPAGSTGPGGTFQVGYMDVPQNNQNGNYTLVMSDRGKHIYDAGSVTDTKTIPANGTVAFPIGSTVTFINRNNTSITLAITTDTLLWAPTMTAGNRTLGVGAVATIIKIASTLWVLTGVGIT